MTVEKRVGLWAALKALRRVEMTVALMAEIMVAKMVVWRVALWAE